MKNVDKINELIAEKGLKNCHINHDGRCNITLNDGSIVCVHGGNLDSTHVHIKTSEGEVVSEDISF